MTALCVPDAAQRGDLVVFLERALRLDSAAVVRLRARADGLLGAWVATGFDVLACRVIPATARPSDATCGAEAMRDGLRAPDASGWCDAGYSMDSAWRGALPPETGFCQLDDIPAAVLAGLARQGVELARQHAGPQGPPASLLDQAVLGVSAGGESLAVPMRCVMALAAMGFMSGVSEDMVRVRVSPAWLRIDARYGSVFRRRAGLGLSVR